MLEVKVVLSEMAGLFEVIKDRDNYEGIVDICMDKLSDISSQLDSYARKSEDKDTRGWG